MKRGVRQRNKKSGEKRPATETTEENNSRVTSLAPKAGKQDEEQEISSCNLGPTLHS